MTSELNAMDFPNSTKYVVDCEYNSDSDSLISMAIVPLWPMSSGSNLLEPIALPDQEFYEVIAPLPVVVSDWVAVNVVPHLSKTGIPFKEFQRKLQQFLADHSVTELHYDWCEDIAYFNQAMVTGPGERIELPLHRRGHGLKPISYLGHVHHGGVESKSEVKHNALYDARAIAAALRKRMYGIP